MLKGAAIVADVFECLAEGEVDIDSILPGGRRLGAGGQRFERGKIGIARAKGFQFACDCSALRRRSGLRARAWS